MWDDQRYERGLKTPGTSDPPDVSTSHFPAPPDLNGESEDRGVPSSYDRRHIDMRAGWKSPSYMRGFARGHATMGTKDADLMSTRGGQTRAHRGRWRGGCWATDGG